MEKEYKNCQNCKNSFEITSEDMEFYNKISVPAPTWCSECRNIRRLVWRNERALYGRKCDLCGKHIISVYPFGSIFPVYCYECWHSDKWDSLNYGQDYDFSKTFFEQLKKLYNKVPKYALYNVNQVRSEYCNICVDLKDCYLLFGSWFSENCSYGVSVLNSKDIFDSLWVDKSESSAYLIDCNNCYKTFFSQNCMNCIDSAFIYDCNNCQNCLFSSNLRNKQYYINNKQSTKEEFESLKENSMRSSEALKKSLGNFNSIKINALQKFMIGKNYVNVAGNFIYNSKDLGNSYFASDVENIKDGIKIVKGQKDSRDIFGVSAGELMYESLNVDFSSRGKFLLHGVNLMNSQYSVDVHNSSSIFGCIGLRNKQYCILNKQYTPESYQETVNRIKEQMDQIPYIDKKGRVYKYGEFFPPEISPFAYNETIAQEYFPLTKEQAINQGYSWKDPEERNIKITLKTEELKDNIKDVTDDITKEIIECEHKGECNEQCTTAFKIIPQELEFYRKLNLPLPRLCPNCRHYQRIKQRNPLKLWKRKCQCNQNTTETKTLKYINTTTHSHRDQPCHNEFETTYAPERPEIVYCESCYQQEAA